MVIKMSWNALGRASLTLLALASASPAAARIDHDDQLWTAFSAQGHVNDKVLVSAGLTVRAGDAADGIYEAVPSVGVGYEINDDISVWAYFETYDRYGTGATRHEDRPFQQVNVKLGSFLGGNWSSRTRLEERFVDYGADTGFNLREQLSYSRPFHEGGKTALSVWSEAFFALNDTDWGERDGFERVRSFVGVKTPLQEDVTLEAGYLNQYSAKPGADEMAHVASLSLAYSF